MTQLNPNTPILLLATADKLYEDLPDEVKKFGLSNLVTICTQIILDKGNVFSVSKRSNGTPFA